MQYGWMSEVFGRKVRRPVALSGHIGQLAGIQLSGSMQPMNRWSNRPTMSALPERGQHVQNSGASRYGCSEILHSGNWTDGPEAASAESAQLPP